MVWNRKRTNFFIILEIFFSFLVLFTVITFGVYYADNYRQPLGFNYQNIWDISIQPQGNNTKEDKSGPLVNAKQIFLAVEELPEVEAVAGTYNAPYGTSNSMSAVAVNGREIRYGFNDASDSFKDLVGLEIMRGRWFGPEDEATNYRPIVINQRLSRAVFGEEDPLGKRFGDPPRITASATAEERKERRVIGVIADFRQDGELAVPGNYLFERQSVSLPTDKPPNQLLIKVRPGTTAAFEEKLVRNLQAVAKDWSFDIEPLSNMRETNFKLYLAPMIAAGLVASFLMIMVALGLTGVLWQNVTQRTKEIGLRRAKGATAGKIHLQILGELVVIASFGLILGVAIIVQFPLLDLIGFISSKVYLTSLAMSLTLIYLLTILCGLYPSWLATKVQPAEALHYE
jgi:putative ABC transport system permease protein